MLLLAGAVVGVLMGLSGAGGGILALPLLIVVAGMPAADASLIALMAVAPAAVIGTAEGLLARRVRYRGAALMAAAGLLISPLGVHAGRVLPEKVLLAMLAGVMVLVGLRMYAQLRASRQDTAGQRFVPCRMDPITLRLDLTFPCSASLAATGAAAGFFTGMLGLGGGFLIVPALRRLSDVTMHEIVATSLMVTAVVACGALATAMFRGLLPPLAMGAPFAAGAVAGMVAGRLLARHLDAARVQWSFIALTVVAAVTVLLRLAFAG